MLRENIKLNFLVIRFSSIGDIVLITPVLRLIKKYFPNSILHFLTKEKFKNVVKLNPNIDQLHLLGSDYNKCIDELKSIKFDFVIDLHNNLRSHKIRWSLNISKPKDFSEQEYSILPALKSSNRIFTLNKLDFKKMLLTVFKINKLPNVHITDREIETLKTFGIENDNLGLEYYISSEDEQQAKNIINNIDYYTAFVIGATYSTKRLPNNLISDICSGICSTIILLGGPDDIAASEFVINNSSNKNIINLCGKVSLNVSAGIVKNAKLVIAHDTGLMHIASAYHKNVLTIWGNTVPEFGMYACCPGNLSKDFQVFCKCRPCNKLGHKSCPKKHFNCMNNQNIKEIINTANNILNQNI
ncbi:MAG: glycosyltransferase family 9 protein [Bacteroidales bacterium]|nr:glycosyltransferase family 9 protein [Bacteroidales bacterium]